MTETFLDWAVSRGAELSGNAILHFGDPGMEYRAARSGVAIFDRSDRGRLRISGSEALDLLHRTTTQDLKSLRPGQGAFTVIQTETAKILDWVTLWARDEDLVAVTGRDRAEADREWIDRLIIMDDVVVDEMTRGTALFEMVGPEAEDLAGTLLANSAASLVPCAHQLFEWRGIRGLIARGRAAAIPSFWMLLDGADQVRAMEALGDVARVGGELASESIRVETGQPLPGRELTTETNPLEAGLEDAIGFRKGCYTGQEVIARMITYKSVKRRLAGFVFEGTVLGPEFGQSFQVRQASGSSSGADTGRGAKAETAADASDDTAGRAADIAGAAPARNAPVGRLTSAVFCYGVGRYAGIGIVAQEFAAPGTAVTVETDDGPVPARVVALPMAVAPIWPTG